MNSKFDEILKINGNPPSQSVVYQKRLNRIKEAISWPIGTFENKEYTTIWSGEQGYEIKLGKPGKESQTNYAGQLNIHDMRPDIFHQGENLNLAATFGNVIYDLEEVARTDRYCVELLAVLFFRSAFLLDHKEHRDETNKVFFRYEPNLEVVKYITERIPELHGMPPIVFLQYIDAIALNEDVKYYSKGKNLKHQNTGGKNNYLTYVMITAVMTGDLPISAIASKLLRSNVSAISNKDALNVLPHLRGRNLLP